MTRLRTVRASGGQTTLSDGPTRDRWTLNARYLRSLDADNLLRPYRAEAGLWSHSGSWGTTVGTVAPDGPQTWHWGWESITSDLRGHILGHWLSAAARVGQYDGEVAARAAVIVGELAACQRANGGQWAGSIPPAYLDRLAEGGEVWAPQYVVHKTFLGLLDQYRIAGNQQALDVASAFAGWFHEWSGKLSRDQLDDVLDRETGGMLEVWADLLEFTGDQVAGDLIDRYDRRRFFDPLLAGDDVLTNKHANTQIAEILGAARAWEVTGERRWREVVEAFWDSAVETRGTYCTGGSSCGEVWQPPGEQSARLHAVQEHCLVYNLMRLADFLFRWTGDDRYADYWERNLVNGIWAQQHPDTGMPAYFLPLAAGSRKQWGRPTEDFWCCHGTLLQAQAGVDETALYVDDAGISICQYLETTTSWADLFGGRVEVAITTDAEQGVVLGQRQTFQGAAGIQELSRRLPRRRPDQRVYVVEVRCEQPSAFEVRLRIPRWAAGPPVVEVDGQAAPAEVHDGWIVMSREWSGHRIRLTVPSGLSTVPLPDRPELVAMLDGPVVLAGLTEQETMLSGDPTEPTSFLTPDQDRHHSWWRTGTYRTFGQTTGLRFVPLAEIRDEPYTVYFPVRPG
ncbi:beta-L-arabinofuranosidase domain-containing protein [Kribbella monticola]|uniref:beta-L-arabinofuranosidase domain-containing protein n=1 Tax=Kribbella monticola TaxID=2185285 RepID=UPI000DD470CA|nr:beta-L-arabinofuranosidase domain-containing protein [Kribbella monticola]